MKLFGHKHEWTLIGWYLECLGFGKVIVFCDAETYNLCIGESR